MCITSITLTARHSALPYRRLTSNWAEQDTDCYTSVMAMHSRNSLATSVRNNRIHFIHGCGNQLKVIKTSRTLHSFTYIYIFTVNWTRMTENANKRANRSTWTTVVGVVVVAIDTFRWKNVFEDDDDDCERNGQRCTAYTHRATNWMCFGRLCVISNLFHLVLLLLGG